MLHRSLIVVSSLAFLGIGCTHTPKFGAFDSEVLSKADSFVSGRVEALDSRAVVDNIDFVYGVALSPAGDRVAYTRLAGKKYNLALWSVAEQPAKKLWDIEVNDYEYDVEGVDFSPDGQLVVTSGRDGAVRFFSTADGKKVGEFFAEEPLSAVAFVDGKHVVAGSARGLLTLITAPEGAYVSELRAHNDEVRSIAPLPDGRVVTGGWDRTIAVLEIAPAPVSVNEINLVLGSTLEKLTVVRAGLDGRFGIFAFDAANPQVIVSSELAKSAGIQEGLLSESVQVGTRSARVARGRSIHLKNLQLTGVDVAICTECLPKGVHGLLGAPVLGRFETRTNPITGELQLSAKEKVDPATLPQAPTLREVKRHTFPAFVNDLSVDRSGQRLGVAFSHEKAERTRQIYEREKAGVPAPLHEDDMAAIVATDSGELIRKWRKHLGVVSTAAISPDGHTLVSGGWDKNLFVWNEGEDRPKARDEYGWSLRRIRFARDGRFIAVAAWTPQNAVGSHESDPSCVVYDVAYENGKVVAPQAQAGR